MGKRYIERPTARQIVSKADRDAAYELKRDAAESWLAQNYAPTPEAPRAPRGEVDSFTRSIIEMDAYVTAQDNHNETPDPMGKTGHYEPKSIHDPAPRARITREAPKKRKGRDPWAVSEDCEIPDYRRRQTFIIEDAQGRARGAIEINPYSKRVRIGGFGL